MTVTLPDPADEGRHPGQEPEAFWFWFASPEGDRGGYAGVELGPGGDAAYHAGLVRAGEPLLHVTDLAAGRPRGEGLLLKAEGLFADAMCEDPYVQWTVVNECYGVELDDPWEAVGRAYGTPRPVAFDLEWYATAPPAAVPGGYGQAGEVLGLVELHDGVLELDRPFPAWRLHVWGGVWLPPGDPVGGPAGEPALLAPLRRADGSVLGMALTATGWRCWRQPRAWRPASGATPRRPSAGR